MPGESSRHVLRQLDALFNQGVSGPLSDEELLEQFVDGTEEIAGAAFSALQHRHGAMVLGVCRRVLGNRHAAEDAFQATFLVLARKAPAIARREQLACWLHGVAQRAAMDARIRAARQHAKEKRLRIMSSVERMDEFEKAELRSVLDEELGRLSQRHRAAIVLCELEGLSRREAARRLGISEGTLSSRLARAKIQLRERLTRRGMALSTAALAAALTENAQAVTVPGVLIDSTIRFATLLGTGSSLAGVASTSVITLTEGVLRAMLLSKLKFAFLGLVTAALISTGAGVVAQDRPSDNDRLKNLERKVDRLLEALGSQNRGASSANRTTDSKPVENPSTPAVILTPAVPAVPPPALAAVPQPPATPGVLPPTPAQPAYPPAITATPALPHQVAPPVMAPPRGVPHSNSLAGRVEILEQRLANLERRLGELESRMNGVNSRSYRLQPSRNVPGAFPAPRAEGLPDATARPGPSAAPTDEPALATVPVEPGVTAPEASPAPPTAPVPLSTPSGPSVPEPEAVPPAQPSSSM